MPDGTEEQLDDAADQLYAVAPEEFITTRTALAKQAKEAGDKTSAAQIAALPKPTVAAWLLNTFARRRPDAVDQLVDLGAELRAAQHDLAPAELKALNRQRHDVVAAFARQVEALARDLGRPVTASVGQQVDETLRAAFADGDVGAALRAGRLTASLSYAGMGAGSSSGAPLRVTPHRSAARAPSAELAAQRRKVQQAETAADAAAAAASAAGAELRRHEQALSEWGDRERDLAGRLEALRAQLAHTEAEVADARRRRQAVERERVDAASADADAREALSRARAALDALRDDGAVTARLARRTKKESPR